MLQLGHKNIKIKAGRLIHFLRGLKVLTEQQIQQSFRKLFQGGEVTSETVDKAEELIDQLRLESPLRHRLSTELEEVRNMCAAK